MGPILLISNCASSTEAESLADALVERQLAAAVQIVGPVRSRYRWQGTVQRKREWMLIIKTSARCEAAIEKLIKELHSYTLPGLIKLDIAGGELQYLQWILDQSSAAS